MSINLGKRSKFTQSLRKQGSGSTLSSTGGEPLNPSYVQSQLDEARASLRSHADTLHDVEYERDILRIEVGKALAERDEALEQTKNLEQTLEALRQELAGARQAAGSQDRSSAFFHDQLAGMEASIASERYAWKLAQEAADQSIRNLEGERDRLQRELQAVQQGYSDVRAALEAMWQDKDAMRQVLAETRAELGHRMGELDMLEERRIVVDSGLDVLRQAAGQRDELVAYLHERIARLEAAFKRERHDVNAGGEAAETLRPVETYPWESVALPELRGEMDQLRDTTEQQIRKRSAPEGRPVVPNRLDAVYGSHSQISEETIPGALRIDSEEETSSNSPQTARIYPSGTGSRSLASLLRTVSGAINQIYAARVEGTADETMARRYLASDTLVSQSILEAFLMACLAGMLVVSLLQLVTYPLCPQDCGHGTLTPQHRQD